MMKRTIPPSKTTDPAKYVDDLINRPVAAAFSCWRLVIEVQRGLFGRELPSLLDVVRRGAAGPVENARQFAGHPERARWQESDYPVNGAVVLMRQSGANLGAFEHAGVYVDLDGGGVLHSDQPHGVVFDTLPMLAVRGWEPVFLIPRAQ